MLRTHTCGELRLSDVEKEQEIILCGWVRRIRDKGKLLWIDLRDRYGITQLFLEEDSTDPKLLELVREKMGRECVIKATGKLIERTSKNLDIPTGEVELKVTSLEILNGSKTPPFLVEDDTDGGDELRMKYRYLDLRRPKLQNNMMLRHKMAQAMRRYLDTKDFMEIETPFLIKSTPEGARDFVVPSRMHPGEFYALPQSPQTFKQILMLGGYDKYFQIVRCFRDEDLRADRQPEFTQIDCEMSFVSQEDILNNFEGLLKYLFKELKGINIENDFPRMTYDEAMKTYGNDKPDIRFGMKFKEMNAVTKGRDFKVFDDAELVVGIKADDCAGYSRKQLDALTKFVKKPQIGATGLIYLKCNADGTLKSSVDKFFNEEDLKKWAELFDAKAGDLILVLAGNADKTRKAMSELRLEMGNQLDLRKADDYKPLWVLDFPLLEWGEEENRWFAMHHPFTSPKKEDLEKLNSNPADVRADAYDLVLNGVEVGGGSIRIYDRPLQEKMLSFLGFSDEEAKAQFGFLMDAFEYGAPPHGGIALGFDRLCALFGGEQSIRDFIAFPKNNAGKDLMIDAPAKIDEKQLDELEIKVDLKAKV
ncbi:aspartyl-tRNA synthetase [Bernardetia litoralis DSM 6794]|uniref:Aspartate--tRNA ligase n=1 Tax=Bernardetia litoralis (strain ATCC 23117 / DSM 6794 / NBRC 15988 / NCIMB 1366 / Fx l1 / Sio-4) TaxID=880071 RepID=I4AGV4_BERLS|nr:aspartate--tRNA ligase [Bernardetia litoralis]AFM03189.1 aspartyl-tRNA synthetase [Bernardetia litoralis DSM 6794]